VDSILSPSYRFRYLRGLPCRQTIPRSPVSSYPFIEGGFSLRALKKCVQVLVLVSFSGTGAGSSVGAFLEYVNIGVSISSKLSIAARFIRRCWKFPSMLPMQSRFSCCSRWKHRGHSSLRCVGLRYLFSSGCGLWG